MALDNQPSRRLLDVLAQVAPGTPLREGFERIVRGRTGALVVLGQTKTVKQLCTGGFALDVPYSPTALRELAKMDGAIVLSAGPLGGADGGSPDTGRIVQAGVQLMPDPAIETAETGTRHRTAERVARQTGVPVVSVSASMGTISLYVDTDRHLIEHSDQLLSRAHQALEALERYKARLARRVDRLSALEVHDQVTVRDFAQVAQLIEMVSRLDRELAGYVVELGTDGRLLTLQLHDLTSEVAALQRLLQQDYLPPERQQAGLAGLAGLTVAELQEPAVVARALGFGPGEPLDHRLMARGYRQVAQIHRLPAVLGIRLVERFGSLQALFAASSADLQEVDGVGENRARMIRDGLVRLAESAYSEHVD